MVCAPSEDADQPGHPPSLIRVFAVSMKKAWVLSYPLSAEWRLWSDWADARMIWDFAGCTVILLVCHAAALMFLNRKDCNNAEDAFQINNHFEIYGLTNIGDQDTCSCICKIKIKNGCKTVLLKWLQHSFPIYLRRKWSEYRWRSIMRQKCWNSFLLC